MVNVKFLNTLAQMPTYGSDYAAGADLYAATEHDIEIAPGQTIKIGTGLAMEIPHGWQGGIYARSGLAVKQGLRPANCVGVIDSDYRGEIIVAIHNDSDRDQVIPAGARIAQLILHPAYRVEFNQAEDLDTTTRADGGFGSTGLK